MIEIHEAYKKAKLARKKRAASEVARKSAKEVDLNQLEPIEEEADESRGSFADKGGPAGPDFDDVNMLLSKSEAEVEEEYRQKRESLKRSVRMSVASKRSD